MSFEKSIGYAIFVMFITIFMMMGLWIWRKEK
jgi:hypothetical protein